MAHAYTPGLRVAKKTIIRKKRILPLKGDVVKKVGDRVLRDEIVAKTDLPGEVHTVNIVNRLGIMPDEINNYMLKKVGDTIAKDEIIAESKSFIKWFKTKIESPISGKIESISPVTGQVLLREPPRPVEVHAYLNGTIAETIPREGVVIESVASFIQGIFGIGGEVWGPLEFVAKAPSEALDASKLNASHKGKILVAGSFASFEAINKAISVGATGLIVGGIRDGDLRQILGYDLGVAITGTEKVGITLVLTEGFGEIAMADRTFNALKAREGAIASISGATQIRAGVIRPEIIIPYDDEDAKSALCDEGGEAQSVKPGDSIRIIRQPYFGKIGVVHSLPPELQAIESETKARILEVIFPDSPKPVVIPRANIELIQE
ncbi:MAG: hypothetical protein HQK50_09150 [Oligoflexia bacterium]|nr:hypothetical protein [Oligoflexia bacterium]MBF0365726.1 hypothetical protein [Oligoflexia bacterium]